MGLWFFFGRLDIYIYIYIERERDREKGRERERERESGRVSEKFGTLPFALNPLVPSMKNNLILTLNRVRD